MGEKLSNIKKGTETFINNWNNFFETCGKVGGFFNKCFNEEGYLVALLKDITPQVVLPVLLILIILRVLGFKETEKYIMLTFVIALVIAIL